MAAASADSAEKMHRNKSQNLYEFIINYFSKKNKAENSENAWQYGEKQDEIGAKSNLCTKSQKMKFTKNPENSE